MITRLDDPESARRWCAEVRERGASLGFVPTMGALHDGHLGLVARARAENEMVCVSVFVNPLQFNDPRDFERYPRDFAADADLLASVRCDMVFSGTLEQFFPQARGDRSRIEMREPGPAALGLEGRQRPGHFAGVATIVARLFEIVAPTRAYFGAKDFQQTLVVADVARSLGSPHIVVCPTAREGSGLALSSRNALLLPAAREQATAIHRALAGARRAWREQGERDPRTLDARMLEVLRGAGLEVEYAELRDPEHWSADEPRTPLRRAIALIAARCGGVRLIDNMRLDDAQT
jgi:pantoate--beta-alanine ligase